jgi:tetratricopeptide (TPR) repeat protein
MTRQHFPKTCSDSKIATLLSSIRADEPHGFRELEASLRDYPADPRLHFLKGSLLASRQDYVAARAEMRRAVDLAPDYGIARFQLGFLCLTSGEPHAAQEAWGPLHALPHEHYLRLFVVGLCHLIQDEFDDSIRSLQEGMAHNHENAPLNRDIQLIIDEMRAQRVGKGRAGDAVSSVDLLLQQAALKASKH